MAFSRETKTKAMIACARYCPLCGQWKGQKVECHHIIHESKGGDDSLSNCIPLCFDCHADQATYDVEHPVGTKYQPEELRARRDQLYKKIENGGLLSISPEHAEVDKLIFHNMRVSLPRINELDYLQDSSFAAWSFPTSMFQQLWTYKAFAKHPESEFLDPELENLRLSLVSAIGNFGEVIATKTFPTRIPGYNQIPEVWRTDFPDRHSAAVRELQEAADQLVIAYTIMIRVGRRRLVVP